MHNTYAREKRARREAEHQAREEAREAEERRIAGLSLWERIEEAADMQAVRDILHLFDERLDALEGKTCA